MKILIYADNHFCEAYSIIQKYGLKYSKRIENQLQTMSWLKELAQEKQCDLVISLGDFFDKSELTDQEITASKDIEWIELPTYFLVGNHESSENELHFNSTKTLESETRFIISEPQKAIIGDCELCFLPYITDAIRQPLNEYFGEKSTTYRVIFSHNDIKGIQMGPVISKLGFDIPEIEANCDLFLNGHLHNGIAITEKIINLGNITGKDFGEDSFKYTHNALLLDTETLQLEFIENPYAFNFYKLEIMTESDLNKIEKVKNNAVLSIKCKDILLEQLRAKLAAFSDKLVETRIIAIRDSLDNSETSINLSELTVDHLARFVECCRENIEASDILDLELAEVCK